MKQGHNGVDFELKVAKAKVASAKSGEGVFTKNRGAKTIMFFLNGDVKKGELIVGFSFISERYVGMLRIHVVEEIQDM